MKSFNSALIVGLTPLLGIAGLVLLGLLEGWTGMIWLVLLLFGIAYIPIYYAGYKILAQSGK